MAYKARVLDCLTAEAKRFFSEELREKGSASSLKNIEQLIAGEVRPYKIAACVFLATTLLAGGFLVFKKTSAERQQLEAMRVENLKMREERDDAVRKLAGVSTSQAQSTKPDMFRLEEMADIAPEQFYTQLTFLAETKQLPREELARLIRIGAAKDPVYALQRVRRVKALTSALGSKEFRKLVKNGTSKEE